jgi:hypothetical protein
LVFKGARQRGHVTSRALDIPVKAGDLPKPVTNRQQPIYQWFRPKTVRALHEEGVTTVGDLVDLIKRRGPGRWRASPRIGLGRARAMLGHEPTVRRT